ncbi:nuclear transport factor 2 family protein [Gemmatimonas aurantiaca]|uniref:nuclear transport factor 2 family protein n=1 Tax=Gemmatimonas aurantiaca TaxID=173480 RepID=UPI00301BCFCC
MNLSRPVLARARFRRRVWFSLCSAALAAGALGVTALPVAAQSIGAPEEQQAVMAVVRRLFDGMRAADSSMVRSVFDPRLRMITAATRNGAPVVTIEQGADGFVKSVGTPRPDKIDERIRNERVHIDGTLASVWVDYGLFIGPKFSHCGIDHFLLVRNDGAWKILEIADTRRTTGCEQWTR